MKKTILLTGGMGYIGSHVCVELLQAGFEVLIIDNLCNSSITVLDRVEDITGKKPIFFEGDIRDRSFLSNIFSLHNIDAVIHLAGLKSVADSVKNPITYYDTNVNGTIILIDVMRDSNCRNIVFSSSATVYGQPEDLPIKEDFKVGAVNPYGSSKLISESILEDLYNSDKKWSIGVLRYFNPVGAHKSGLIGEDPKDTPNNLMPIISQVAMKCRDEILIFGGDYKTEDGTGVRDYLHVLDLANAHVKSVECILNSNRFFTVNLGTGVGYSVLHMIKTYERVSNQSIQYRIVERREGDVAECYADPSMAKKILDWSATQTLQEMCEDEWRWKSKNPSGYCFE